MQTTWLQAFFDVKFGGERERGKGHEKKRGGKKWEGRESRLKERKEGAYKG